MIRIIGLTSDLFRDQPSVRMPYLLIDYPLIILFIEFSTHQKNIVI